MLKICNLEDVVSRQNFESLHKSGIKTLHQVVTSSTSELRSLSDLSSAEISIARQQCANALLSWKTSHHRDSLSLDGLLKGSLPPGTITELYGPSGAGKTQLALQAAAHHCQTGVVYICTEDPFPSTRFQQLAAHINHQEGKPQNVVFGDKTFVLHLTEPEDLRVCVQGRLPLLLQQHPGIRLVIVDSIAAPFRGQYENCNMSRARVLKEIGFGLLQIAKTHNLAVLCINQVSDNMSSSMPEYVPCLGLCWSNMLTHRLRLVRSNSSMQRSLTAHFSSEVSNEEKCFLTITELGVMLVKQYSVA